MSRSKAANAPHQTRWLAPAAVFDGRVLRTNTSVRIDDGLVAALVEQRDLPAGVVPETVSEILTPGFVDLQVNGGGGALFNTAPNESGLRTIAEAHRRGGTARLLPTVITDAPHVLEQACAAILQNHGRHGVAGIHIEGPHISLLKRGTHKTAFIRPYDAHTDRQITVLREAGIPVVITLAPETMAKGTIASLVERGVIVSLGHSAATYAETVAALKEGAQTFTHLMNAMPPLESRNPGIVAAALNADVYCSIILDGVHVLPEMLAVLINARHRIGKMIAVTDAMPTLFGPDRFQLYDGMEVRLEGNRLVNPEGSLAGAHVSMIQSLACLTQTLQLPLEQALGFVITNPCDLIGVSPDIVGMAGDDLLLLAADASDCRFLGSLPKNQAV